jgi:hypothetical protein
VGLSGGFSRHTGVVDVRAIYQNVDGNRIILRNLTNDSFANGNGDDWNKGLFVGYRFICNNWIWDGEFNVDLYQTEPDFFFRFNSHFALATVTPPAAGEFVVPFQAMRRYKHGPAFGITGRWGYTMSPYFLPYIVMGLETNKDKLEFTIEGPTSLFANPIVLYNAQQQVRGIAGFGAELPLLFICEQLSIRLEYRFYALDHVLNPRGTLYGKLPTALGTLDLNNDFSMSLRPKFNTGRIALLWNFL